LADAHRRGRARLDGLSAPAAVNCPMDHPTFRAHVEQLLVPTLRRRDVVVFDNLVVHKNTRRSAPRLKQSARGSALPPYSSHFNPIELAFANGRRCIVSASGTRARRRFHTYPLGYIHIDLAEVWTEEGRCIYSLPSIASASSRSPSSTARRRGASPRISSAG